jgi:hypothetical protein
VEVEVFNNGKQRLSCFYPTVPLSVFGRPEGMVKVKVPQQENFVIIEVQLVNSLSQVSDGSSSSFIVDIDDLEFVAESGVDDC